jgi:carnitine O-acetyltransferase
MFNPLKLTHKYQMKSFSKYYSSKMNQFAESMPHLPIPPLEDTLNRYLKVLENIVDTKTFNEHKSKVDKFRIDGKLVDSQLRGLEKITENWMQGFWSTMYLKIREPQTIYVSPFILFGPDSNPARNESQVLKSAAWIAAGTRFAQKVYNEELPPEVLPGNVPLCTSQYKLLVGASRIPQPVKDAFKVFPNSRHVAVLSGGNFYKVWVTDENNQPIPEAHIAQSLLEIKNNFQNSTSQFSSAIGSAGHRDKWAALKSDLSEDPENRKNFEEIDSALFVVCLDDTNPQNLSHFCQIALYGGRHNVGNRYYDKLMLFFCPNGEGGCVIEHTAVDGITVFRMIQETYNDVQTQPLVHLNTEQVRENDKYGVVALPISTTQKQRELMAEIEYELKELIVATDMEEIEFQDFGKNMIKKFGVSPDAFYQAAAQIATFRTLNKLVSTYESSSVAHYKHGRTETIRSLTKEMKLFVEAFEDPNVNNKAKVDALKNAAKRHVEVVKACKSGEGQDRHLQGLYWRSLQLADSVENFKMPDFFDATYKEYMSNKLSTSNVGGGFVGARLFGFGAVHSEGLGLGYMINDNSLSGSVTSYTGKAPAFKKNIFNALRELKAVCESQAVKE